MIDRTIRIKGLIDKVTAERFAELERLCDSAVTLMYIFRSMKLIHKIRVDITMTA